MVNCPICGRSVKQLNINSHLDSNCATFVESDSFDKSSPDEPLQRFSPASTFFQSSLPITKKLNETPYAERQAPCSTTRVHSSSTIKRAPDLSPQFEDRGPPPKKPKPSAFEAAAPLADRMRPKTLDDVCGQDLVGPNGVLRGLIEQDKVPSMILWGGSGTGKTTIARIIASVVGSRFVEINSTSSNVAECKKIFSEAKNEMSLTGRKTIIFCDEIHRFNKGQQDVFLGPVESGQVTL